MEILPNELKAKVTSAEAACQLIKSNMSVGMSGFTQVGYPKAVPAALAASGHADNLTIFTGASVGDDLDGVLSRAGLMKRRYPYQSNSSLRKMINSAELSYADMHLSSFPFHLKRQAGAHVDIAVVECVAITKDGLVPAAAVGATDAFVRAADKVIVELNQSLPSALIGMHDIYEIEAAPNSAPIPICHPLDRIGTSYIPCPLEKIAAIVITSEWDMPARLTAPDAVSEKIGDNIVKFLLGEVEAGRLPENLGPIQSGVGSVANCVLNALEKSGLRDLTMFTETFQDTALELLEKGVLSGASTTAVSFSKDVQKRFYDNLGDYCSSIVLRPQELSNHPELIRRLGLVAMNTPIELDLCGNVNSTHIMGSAIMNGIGGSGDFARNAAINIFATSSVAKGGNISCIVPLVSHVDHTEHDTQIIVTEQGVADLRFKTPQERAELLIENCAHPDYKPLLWEYLNKTRALPNGKHVPIDLKEAFSWHIRYEETGTMK